MVASEIVPAFVSDCTTPFTVIDAAVMLHVACWHVRIASVSITKEPFTWTSCARLLGAVTEHDVVHPAHSVALAPHANAKHQMMMARSMKPVIQHSR